MEDVSECHDTPDAIVVQKHIPRGWSRKEVRGILRGQRLEVAQEIFFQRRLGCLKRLAPVAQAQFKAEGEVVIAFRAGVTA